jgi:hypothetical protein
VDIFNKALVLWDNLDSKLKAEFFRQERLGAESEFYSFSCNVWYLVNIQCKLRATGVYRVKPGTEKPLPTTRPTDELDLLQLCKPVLAWHPETLSAMKAWTHGWKLLTTNGVWVSIEVSSWEKGFCYRAKAEVKQNLIHREGLKSSYKADSYKLWVALDKADRLIKTMTGGDPKLKAAYEKEIE